MATVTVLVRGEAFNSRRTAEAMRMSVGQTLAENDVRLIFAGDAVYTLGDVNPAVIDGGDIRRPLETLRMLGHRLYAEAESLDERAMGALPKGVERVPRREIAEMLARSDVTLTW